MKNKEIFTFRSALNEVDYIKGKVFAFAVFKNKEILDQEIKALNEIKKEPHPDYINFENERMLLCENHSEKDANNNPQFNYNPDGSKAYKISDIQIFNAEYEILAEKYKSVLDDMIEAKRSYNELLEKESDIQLKKVNFKDLPDDVNALFLEKIKFMIE
jgi:hypothetical protein